jgi:hypothetical protein
LMSINSSPLKSADLMRNEVRKGYMLPLIVPFEKFFL